MLGEKAAFTLGGGDADLGVVLLHGFTGTPYEVRYLGDQLARAGFAVHAPLLPGHGTTLDELDATTWEDWACCVDGAVDAMRVRHRHIAVVGQSLGGLLALYCASRRDTQTIAAVASLAAPLWLEGLSARVLRWARAGKLPIKAIPKLGGSDIRDPRARAMNPCYPAIPVKALAQLATFMDVAHARLSHVTQPVLVLHAREDHTAPVACAPRIAEATRAIRLRILPRSYHLIAVDVERDIVAAEVAHFLRTHVHVRKDDLRCLTT